MTRAIRTSLLFVLAAALLALQPTADAARRQTDEEVAQAAVTKIETAFNKSKTKIISIGEGTVASINRLQARNTTPSKVTAAAVKAKRDIAKQLVSGQKTLNSEAMKGVKALDKRNAPLFLREQINETKSTRSTELETVALDCYNAIDGALAD